MKKKQKKSSSCIFRAWITRPDGTRDYARDHGLKGFPIESKKQRR